ncbi:TraX family protein [Cytobacillus praedii]|uniref:TraX family protein n=1 Tax=Cytobacillus praedii TaxID=1742358 RepID=UPI003AF6C806
MTISECEVWTLYTPYLSFRLYNGQKGFRLKYFFYFFYPTHIIILYFIGKNLH